MGNATGFRPRSCARTRRGQAHDYGRRAGLLRAGEIGSVENTVAAVNAAVSPLKGQLGLPVVPIDDFERHPAFEHFGLEIRRVLLPIWRLSNTEPGPLTEANKFIVSFEGATDALVHHGEAVVCERLIVHQA